MYASAPNEAAFVQLYEDVLEDPLIANNDKIVQYLERMFLIKEDWAFFYR